MQLERLLELVRGLLFAYLSFLVASVAIENWRLVKSVNPEMNPLPGDGIHDRPVMAQSDIARGQGVEQMMDRFARGQDLLTADGRLELISYPAGLPMQYSVSMGF